MESADKLKALSLLKQAAELLQSYQAPAPTEIPLEITKVAEEHSAPGYSLNLAELQAYVDAHKP